MATALLLARLLLAARADDDLTRPPLVAAGDTGGTTG